jgi:hypothetical protein
MHLKHNQFFESYLKEPSLVLYLGKYCMFKDTRENSASVNCMTCNSLHFADVSAPRCVSAF